MAACHPLVRVIEKLFLNILKPQLERWCWYHPVLAGDKDHASRGSASPRTTCPGGGGILSKGKHGPPIYMRARLVLESRPSADYYQYPLCDTDSNPRWVWSARLA